MSYWFWMWVVTSVCWLVVYNKQMAVERSLEFHVRRLQDQNVMLKKRYEELYFQYAETKTPVMKYEDGEFVRDCQCNGKE